MKTLHLLPVSLGQSPCSLWLPSDCQKLASQLKFFIAENAKTARAYLKEIGTVHTIRDITIHELNAQTPLNEIKTWLQQCPENEIGLVSEAGCPAVADPGAMAVRLAHEMNWKVVPWVGPSSILLGLMASGLDGQRFAFHGYIPIAPAERAKQLKHWESLSQKLSQTQIFIETPYRNMSMIDTLLKTLNPNTRLCLACHINTSQEWIRTQTVAAWRKTQIPNLDKQPCLFLFLA
ncbi:SAM-dependent methyltransferase [Basilea psittacipulmonis]|uniref:SAM-dependent methyltransferase n=1 Tax=Basilea psittacipulmonis DSM 24701 TaxID=1072685 RepID=A0A077DGJ2_9BURK|nr:SAM-dependent methyltransferase [Basilea psittacipulmonis]AIL33256.1 SAM-dependent methyltransferase [Basilea psittacipulmonis DSM 24701]